MAIDRSRKRTRLAMVVVRSPTNQGLGDALLEDQQRVQMQRQAGDSRQIVVMASPEELRAARAARPAAASTSPLAGAASSSVATETQRRLLAYAHRARHALSHRAVADSLSRSCRSEIQRLKGEMRRLQGEIEVTTRSVENMERLTFHLERLTRDFVPGGAGDTDHGSVTLRGTLQSSVGGGEVE